MPALSPSQIQLFRHNGFLRLPSVLPDERVEELKNAIWQDINNEVEPVVRNADGQVVRISNAIDRAPIFYQVATHDLVLDPLESLLGPNIELIKNRHNHATLRTKTEKEGGLHRDVKQWSRTIFTIIFYLEETNLENGCTRIVPGTHHLPGTGGSLYDMAWANELNDQILPVPMPKGGMLVIDSMLVHGPGKNTTPDTRMSMTMGYHSVDEINDVPNPKRVVVRGDGIYNGNDQNY
ncbi:MAG: phytanoyl-CoA dioxygenase family protein [Candidatus Latescibacteria bacterium]|jgi:phytanoyl-CoA hydroxylase|nr:phytanoyl-CoA dioxygenase family protein [Candidatus Latescibacterota bacterium]MBT4140845.1 phytanoyl-CoA dioxygenase family protein [Candidatus Latescibacterota bacterium]MBT5832674.1 phytanoyl-CoA dioxygenase family protein [Candidatus Latescibacterota bacterium]